MTEKTYIGGLGFAETLKAEASEILKTLGASDDIAKATKSLANLLYKTAQVIEHQENTIVRIANELRRLDQDMRFVE